MTLWCVSIQILATKDEQEAKRLVKMLDCPDSVIRLDEEDEK